MKKFFVVCLISIGFFPGLFAQDKYEITEVDILGLGKILSASQISVLGVSIGDEGHESSSPGA